MNIGRRCTLIVLVLLAVMGFTQMISGLSDVEMMEHIDSSQKLNFRLFTLLGGAAIIAILMDFGMEFLKRMKETHWKSALQTGIICVIVAITFTITPLKESELPEQRMIMIGIVVAVIAAVQIIGYIWGKRHRSDENDDDKGEGEE